MTGEERSFITRNAIGLHNSPNATRLAYTLAPELDMSSKATIISMADCFMSIVVYSTNRSECYLGIVPEPNIASDLRSNTVIEISFRLLAIASTKPVFNLALIVLLIKLVDTHGHVQPFREGLVQTIV